MNGQLFYLSLLSTREGHAIHAHVHEIISGLRDRGWSVELFKPEYAEDADPGVLRRLFTFLILQFRMWRALSDADVLYMRRHFAAVPTSLLAGLLGVPQVHEVNAPHEDLFVAWPQFGFLRPVIEVAVRWQLRKAEAVITVTEELASWVKREAKRSEGVYVVPNGANSELFRPDVTSRLNLPEKYVVFVGALARWQGIQTLLEAVGEAPWPEEVKLVVVGDGPDQDLVEDVAERNERIVYLGRCAYQEVPGILAGAIASLIPKNDLAGHSKTGLYPLKLFEAMACGIPVVVTDFPGMADLVRSGECGVVVSRESPLELATAVSHLWKSPEVRKSSGQRGRSLIEAEHSWDARAGQTHEILQSLLSKRAEV